MIGVEIIGTGQFLELFEDTTIDLRLNNPVFTDGEIIPGSISLPFEVPGGQKSARNSRLLNNPDVISNMLAVTRTPARLWYDGTPWKSGVLIVRKATPNIISLNFRFGLTTTAVEDLKKIRIRDLVDEVVTITSDTFTKRIAIRLVDTSDPRKVTINDKLYEFTGFFPNPMWNGVMYTSHAGTTDGANAALAECINTTTPNGVSAAYASGYVTVSVLEADSLQAPLKIIVDPTYYWSMNSTDFDAEYNDPIETYLNFHFNYGGLGGLPNGAIAQKIRFPVVINKLYDDGLIPLQGVNVVLDSGYTLNTFVTPTRTPYNLTSICPFVRWSYVLSRVITAMGVPGAGSFLSGDINTALLPHANSLDEIVAQGYGDWVACQRTFNIKDMVPDWTIPEFLNALRKRFNIGIEYNERTKRLEFTERESVHADKTYIDIRRICAPIEEVVPPDITGLRLKANRNTRDLFSIDDQYETGDPNEEIVSDISGWYREEDRFFEGLAIWNCPTASIKKDSTIVPAMIFYEEKYTTGSGSPFLFPGATIDLSDCTFAFAGVGGMANVRWKNHLRFLMNTRALPCEISFEFRDLLTIDWKKKVRPVEGLNCYVNSINVRLTMKGIEASKCELLTTDLGVLDV